MKFKAYNCIVFTNFQHTKLYPFQNVSLGFILEIFLKFRTFQPRYSYKIYSYKKKTVSYTSKPGSDITRLLHTNALCTRTLKSLADFSSLSMFLLDGCLKTVCVCFTNLRKKENMVASARNEKQLFHGTTSDTVEAICRQNFDWRVCGKNGTVFGKGSYFAVDASYSHCYANATRDEQSSQFMFLAKVLVGLYVKGERNYQRPPRKEPSNPASDLYDSCVDNESNPKIFVVFDKDQFYPEYLITYSALSYTVGDRNILQSPIVATVLISNPALSQVHTINSPALSTSTTISNSGSSQPQTANQRVTSPRPRTITRNGSDDRLRVSNRRTKSWRISKLCKCVIL